jgi:fructose-1-phosphate kinase PfkB-like protein
VAWDEIRVLPETLEAVAQARALIFGSLAGRSPYNLDQLNRLLAIEGPMKFFDVNLRPPFADPALVVDIAKRADVIKLNDDEVGKLASWLRTGEATLNTPRSPEALAEACAALAKATNTSRICVTRAAEGAAPWESGNLVCAPAPKVVIKDTVGAGVATGHSVSQADTGSQNEHDQKNPTNKGSGRGLTLSVAQSHNTENGRGDRIRTRRRAMITRNLQRETHKETHKARARRLILN